MKALEKYLLKRNFGVKNVVCSGKLTRLTSGAGIVGQSFVAALTHHNYFKECEDKNIVVLDTREPPGIEKFAQKSVPNQRTYTLSPSSLEQLEMLGTLEHLNQDRCQEFFGMQVWEKQGTGYLKFNKDTDSSKFGMGRTVENDHLVAALYEQLKSNVIMYIEGAQRKGQLIDIELNSGKVIQSKLLVGSDGNTSTVKKLAKIQTRGWSHNQRAIVCTVRTKSPNRELWQRFLPSGPLAVLSMWEDYSSIVWSVPDPLFDHLMQINDIQFVLELNKALQSESEVKTDLIGNLLGPKTKQIAPEVVEICNKRLSFPLNNLTAESFCLDNIALIGDAAHSIHPMAGQGLNLGLLDSSILANVICRALNEGKNFWVEDCLFDYERKAKLNNYTMQSGLEIIKVLYSLDSAPVNIARNLGLEVIQNTPLKSIFKKFASGEFYRDSQFNWKS